VTRRSWVQDPVTGKLIPKEEWNGQRQGGISIQGDLDPFVSPIDGRVISSRSHLRDHNHRHGVTDSRDYSQDFMLKRSDNRIAEMTGQTAAAKVERRELIMRELAKHDH
jgi:hypothetical protein